MESKEILNKVLRVEMIDWQQLKPFQPDNLKILTKQNYEKLKNSIISNHFIASFHVWEEEGTYWILDGHHRKYVLEDLKKEGYILPETLPCSIVDVKSKKEAIKFLLTYSSEYAHADKEGVSEFIHTNDLDFDELCATIDLRNIDIQELKLDNTDCKVDEVETQVDIADKKPIVCPACSHEFMV